MANTCCPIDNLCCFLREVAAEVVQKSQPREASVVFIEVWSISKPRIFCIEWWYNIIDTWTLFCSKYIINTWYSYLSFFITPFTCYTCIFFSFICFLLWCSQLIFVLHMCLGEFYNGLTGEPCRIHGWILLYFYLPQNTCIN